MGNILETQAMTDLKDDISYMRTLAEQGSRGPILGGVFLVVAGAVFGVACLVSWVVRTGMVPVPGWNDFYFWIGANGLFWGIYLVAFTGFRKRCGAASASNAIFGRIWAACGLGVMVALGTTILVSRTLNASIILNAYVPVIYAFYGTAWFASAALAKRSWMYFAAFGSFAFACIVAALAENDLQSPAMALGLFLLLCWPGIKLMTSEARS
jgi:hypothetical protein